MMMFVLRSFFLVASVNRKKKLNTHTHGGYRCDNICDKFDPIKTLIALSTISTSLYTEPKTLHGGRSLGGRSIPIGDQQQRAARYMLLSRSLLQNMGHTTTNLLLLYQRQTDPPFQNLLAQDLVVGHDPLLLHFERG